MTMHSLIKLVLTAAGLLAATGASASYTQSFPGGTIPAGPFGQAFTGNFNLAPAGTLAVNLTVQLDVTGGYNGDFFADLIAPNGLVVQLMNQPGVTAANPFGAGGSGMTITLNDFSPNGSIQAVTSNAKLTGSYQAASPLAAFDSVMLDGNWTLFFADAGSGAGSPTLNSWSLGTAPVPEPGQVVAAALLALLVLTQRRKGDRDGVKTLKVS